jgi:hypothetical protein
VDETEHDETEHNDELEHQDQQAMPPAINNSEQPDNSNNEHQQNGPEQPNAPDQPTKETNGQDQGHRATPEKQQPKWNCLKLFKLIGVILGVGFSVGFFALLIGNIPFVGNRK